MFYVSCGRVQKLKQLYLNSFRRQDIKVNAKALAEAKRIREQAKEKLNMICALKGEGCRRRDYSGMGLSCPQSPNINADERG